MAAGITFIDTAEVYGFGLSEEYTGEFIKQTGEMAGRGGRERRCGACYL